MGHRGPAAAGPAGAGADLHRRCRPPAPCRGAAGTGAGAGPRRGGRAAGAECRIPAGDERDAAAGRAGGSGDRPAGRHGGAAVGGQLPRGLTGTRAACPRRMPPRRPPMPRTVQIAARPEPITVVPEETALIVVDMQHAYLSKGGYLDLCGFDVSGSPPVIEECARVIAACRDAAIPVIYLQNGFSPDMREAPGPAAPVWHKSNALKFMRANEAYAGKLITHGTWDHEIVPEIAPLPGEVVVGKSRYSGFAGTALEQIL